MINEAHASSSACRLRRLLQVETSTPPETTARNMVARLPLSMAEYQGSMVPAQVGTDALRRPAAQRRTAREQGPFPRRSRASSDAMRMGECAAWFTQGQTNRPARARRATALPFLLSRGARLPYSPGRAPGFP
jgi:hypothetical protein